MTTVNKATKRDLQADLALCDAATTGPWFASGEDERPVIAERESVITARGSELAYVGIACEDEEFIAESREGWPEAIRRAIAAEAEVKRMRDGIIRLRDWLVCDLDALESGDATERTVAYADCIESTIRRLDRYVPREVTADVI